jgi:hypothetical protein
MADINYKQGDYVTRDGTDVHQVLDLCPENHCGRFLCVVAPDRRWVRVGESDRDMAGRYKKVDYTPPV